MKIVKNYLLYLSLFFTAITITSCEGEGGEEKAPPSVSISIKDAKEVYEVGEELTILVDFTAEARLIEMSYLTRVDGSIGESLVINTFTAGIANLTNGNYEIIFEVGSDYAGQSFKLEVLIQDGQGRLAKDEVEIAVSE